VIVFTPDQLAVVQSDPDWLAADRLSVILSRRARERYTVEAINASTRASECCHWLAQDLLQEALEHEAAAAAAASAATNGNGHPRVEGTD
jgi:hypothetical protein